MERYLKHLKKQLIKIALKIECLGGHIGVHVLTTGEPPIFVRSQAFAAAEAFISNRMISLETLFVQEADRLARNNIPFESDSIITGTNRTFEGMNSDQKKDEIHRLVLSMYIRVAGKPNAKRIKWDTVRVSGWPENVPKKISNLTVTQLDLIKKLIDTNTIRMSLI